MRKGLKQNRFFLSLLVLLAVTAMPGLAGAKSFVLKGGTSVSEQVWQNQLAQRWANMITERTHTEEEMELWKKTTMETVWPKAIGKHIEQAWVDQWKALLGK